MSPDPDRNAVPPTEPGSHDAFRPRLGAFFMSGADSTVCTPSMESRSFRTPAFGPRPVPLTPTDATWIAKNVPLLRAAEAVLAHDAARLALILATARVRKPTVGRDLAAALDAGGDHLTELADHLAEAARRIRITEVGAPIDEPSADAPPSGETPANSA